jgi:predicted FMN-binding regulatory protein PaiB
MYKSELFEERDLDQLLEFMQAHPFITLIGFDGNYPIATQFLYRLLKMGTVYAWWGM